MLNMYRAYIWTCNDFCVSGLLRSRRREQAMGASRTSAPVVSPPRSHEETLMAGEPVGRSPHTSPLLYAAIHRTATLARRRM